MSEYKVSDVQFQKELEINCYCNQIRGYRVGQWQRMNFRPIVPTISDGGLIDRQRTIDGPAYTFTAEEKAILLEES